MQNINLFRCIKIWGKVMGQPLWEGRRWWDLQKLQVCEKCEGDCEKLKG